MKNSMPTIRSYTNATHVKLENKRVIVEDLPNGDTGLCFKRICTKDILKVK
jgi:hypothetical protein